MSEKEAAVAKDNCDKSESLPPKTDDIISSTLFNGNKFRIVGAVFTGLYVAFYGWVRERRKHAGANALILLI
jgi:hypothetical protein